MTADTMMTMTSEPAEPFGLLRSNDATRWSEAETAALDARLWTLLEQQMSRKTQGDSTSLRVEAVEELIASIRFTLRLYLEQQGLNERVLLTGDLSALFRQAQQAVQARLNETRALYDHAIQTVRVLGCRSLHDTLRGIAQFFAHYDFRLFAHQIPADIDYQLCQPVPGALEGVSYLREYLIRLLAENELLLRLDENREIALLRRAQPDFGEMLMNLYEPISACVIGLALSGGGETLLEVTVTQGERIASELRALTPDAATGRLRQAASLACDHLQLQGSLTRQYLAQTAASLYPRLAASAQGYRGVFTVAE